MEQRRRFSMAVSVPFKSPTDARMAHDALDVDRELRPQLINRSLKVGEGACLEATFEADDLRVLRASVGSFLEHARLCAATLESFGP